MTEQLVRPSSHFSQSAVRTPKSAEIIASRLRGMIVRGEIKVGDNLPTENTLMEQFGVSRPTLREAFRLLESESLLSIRRGSRGGAKVTAPDISVTSRSFGLLLQMSGTTVADVYEARALIEPNIARLLAKRRSADDVARLRKVIEELRELVDSEEAARYDVSTWSRAAYAFHREMLECAGNQTLAYWSAMLEEVINRHMTAVVSRNADPTVVRKGFTKSLKSYTKLVDFIEAGDDEAAGAHWQKHMEVAGKTLMRDISATEVVDLFD